MSKTGLLVVISSPSGGGKTTIIRKVLDSVKGNFKYSISATTRPRRINEVDGHDYYFMDKDEFEEKLRRGDFVEWAEVHGYYYATPKSKLDQWLNEGKIILLDLDVDGGLEIKKKYGDLSLLIFIKPPSVDSLVQRLKSRKTEDEAQIKKRLERLPKEMKKAELYDFQIVNEHLDETVQKVIDIVQKHNNQC
jgi:guanylate kinase